MLLIIGIITIIIIGLVILLAVLTRKQNTTEVPVEKPIVKSEEESEPETFSEEVMQERKRLTPTSFDYGKGYSMESEPEPENPYIEEIKNMSPEMKAIIFAEIFNKKHF